MKLCHFSDTHLGFSEYTKIDPETGLNQREVDFYRAWEQVIEQILTHRPDAVIHAGDLLHTPRPSNRAIRVALEGIQKISRARIPLILISGNHETPRISTTGSLFESIALFDQVYAAFSSEYVCFTIHDTAFHCIPHCSVTEQLERAFQSIKIVPQVKKNILVTHGAWGRKNTFSMGEFNEQRLPDIEKTLNCTFDYIALGHFHRQIDVNDHASYCGSTERTSLNEAGNTCGFLWIDLETQTRTYQAIATRPMMRFPILDCTDLNSVQIYNKLEGLYRPEHRNAILQITLSNLNDHAFLKLDLRAIDELFPDAFHLEKQLLRQKDTTTLVPGQRFIEPLNIEFARYIENVDVGELDKAKLVSLGMKYLEEVLAESQD